MNHIITIFDSFTELTLIMAKAQAKYEKWLEKMENDDGTATDTYCIIREIHWDEEHGYVMKHDRLSIIVRKCS